MADRKRRRTAGVETKRLLKLASDLWMHVDESAVNLGPLTTALLEEVGRVRERFAQLHADLRAARAGKRQC